MRPQLAPQGVAGVILPSPPCGEGVACSAPTEPQPFGCLDARRGVGRGAACYALAPPARIINRILCVRTQRDASAFLASLPDSPNHQMLFARPPLACVRFLASPARSSPYSLVARMGRPPLGSLVARMGRPPLGPLVARMGRPPLGPRMGPSAIRTPHGPRALSAGAKKKAACPAGEHAA